MRYQIGQMKLDIWIHMYSTTWTFKCHTRSSHIMRCIYRFGMYAAHALYIRPPYAIESRWPPRVRGMYAVHTPLALWIRNGQVLIRDIIRSGIAIHTPYAPHVRRPCAIDTQLIRNTSEIVAPEVFHQTISAILLRICSFSRTPYERHSIAGQWNRGIIQMLFVAWHDDVIKWKHFPRYWPFVRGIHRWPVNSPHKGQWRGALMFSLICVWINGWVNSRDAGDLRRYRAHYDVTMMKSWGFLSRCSTIQRKLQNQRFIWDADAACILIILVT